MRAEVADRLEAFIEAGTPWEPGAVAALVAELQSVAVADGDILVERLGRFLEAFIEAGTLWEPGAVAALVAELQSVAVADGDILVERLDRFLGAVGLRQEAGVLEPGTRAEIEAVVYPRLWKVMEAIRDGLPDGEVRTRLEVMHRRLARPFVEETAAR